MTGSNVRCEIDIRNIDVSLVHYTRRHLYSTNLARLQNKFVLEKAFTSKTNMDVDKLSEWQAKLKQYINLEVCILDG